MAARGIGRPPEAFEHLVVLEILRLAAYAQQDWRFSYLRTAGGAEVDLVVDRPGAPKALVEIKSGDQMTERDTRALEGLAGDLAPAECFCLSRDRHEKRIGSTWCLPWQAGIARLGL